MKFLKISAGVALALAMAGCGKDAASTANASTRSYEPKVLSDTTFAVQYRKNSSAALKPLVDAAVDSLWKSLSKAGSDSDAGKGRKFLEESGLRDADVKWAIVSIGGINIAEIERLNKAPDCAFAMAVEHDVDKVLAAFKGSLDESDKLTDVSIPGAKAWTVCATDKEPPNVQSFASLDGKLVLMAETPEKLERLVALYRDGKGASDKFASLSADGGSLLRAYVPSVGDLVKKAVEGTDGALDMFNMIMPDGARVVQSLAELEVSFAGADAGGALLRISLNAANDADADSIRTISNTGLLRLKATLNADESEGAKLAYAIFKDAKVVGEGNNCLLNLALPAEVLDSMVQAIKASVGGDD